MKRAYGKVLILFLSVIVLCVGALFTACEQDGINDTCVDDIHNVGEYLYDDYSHWQVCADCGEIVNYESHDYVNGVCSYCGLVHISKGLVYTLNIDGNSYSVTDVGGCTDSDIDIPSTYDDKAVTSIGEGAFSGCRSLTSINYQGTKSQWQAVNKDYDWDSNTGNYVIYCTDGDISK